MSNRIVFVHGSPRKNGNTRAVTAIAMAAAKESGAEVAEIDAVNLKYTVPGCIGCQKCQDSEAFACAFDDEIAQNVATLPKYDVIVLSCPLYWWSYPAQLKIFIDRMYSLSKLSDPQNYRSMLEGKTLALIATAGGSMEENLELLVRQWKKPADMLGCLFLSCLFPNTSSEVGSLVKDSFALKKAKEFGQALASIKK